MDTKRKRNGINALVEDHLRLVEPIARGIIRRMPPQVQLDDLVQVGRTALLDAAKRYDAKSGRPFPPYAKVKIRGAILDFLVQGDLWWENKTQPLSAEMEAPELAHDPGEDEELSPRQKRLLGRLTAAVRKLGRRERKVLELIYGEGETVTEIARRAIVSGERGPIKTRRRIQQIHSQALAALRSKLAA